MFQDPDATRESYCLPPILAAARTGPDVSSADSNCFLYSQQYFFVYKMVNGIQCLVKMLSSCL